MTSPILSRPTGTPICISPYLTLSVTPALQAITGVVIVNSSTTVIVDTIPVSDYRGAKWFVAVVNHHTNDVEMYEVYGIHQDGTLPFQTVYSSQGNGVSHLVDVTISGGNLQLEITNNEANEIVIYLTRVPVPRIASPTVPIPSGFAPLDIVQIHDTTVPTGTTLIVDTVPFRYHKAEKWLLTLLDLTSGNIEAREIYSVNGIAQFTITEYAIVGPMGINATIDIVVTGTKVTLRVTNNEPNDIAVVGSRIGVTIDHLTTVPPPTTNCAPAPCAQDVECNIYMAFTTGIIIDPATTVIVDQVNHVGYHQVKWLLAASHDTTDETEGFQINMLTHYGSPSFTMYSQVGASFDIDVDVVTSGLNINLEITNNEAFPIVVDLVREPVSV
jgi:hypothetical protein